MMLMKKVFAATLSLLGGVAFGGPLDAAWLVGRTDRPPLSYRVGEKMTFSLELHGAGTLERGRYFIDWKREGDDGKSLKGREALPLATSNIVIETSIDRPGYVRIFAQVTDAAGKAYEKVMPADARTPDGSRLLNGSERESKWVFFDGGAGAELEKLETVPEPDDFDAFWARQRVRLEKVPMRVEKKEVPGAHAGFRTWAVEIACQGVRPVTGYLAIPEAAAQGKRFPAILTCHGYDGDVFVHRSMWGENPRAGYITFDINAHGMKLPAFGADEAYQKALRSEVGSNGKTYALDPVQNADPETAYFNGMCLRIMRALEFLKSLPEWNGRDLESWGWSQGGLQAIWAAALDHDVTKATAGIPWCCDMAAEQVGRLRLGWKVPWTAALGYYDPVNMARRIPKTCTVEIPRAGLGDNLCCPPAGVALFYNRLTCPKRITWYQGSTHGYVPPPPYTQTFSQSAPAAEVADGFDDSLYAPEVQPFEPLTGLKWRLPPGATLSNGWLVVEQKPGADGKCPSTVWATASLDLADCSDRGIEMRLTAAAENLGKPDPVYFGFKFMLRVGFEEGSDAYPGAAAPGQSFLPTELAFATDFVGRTVREATLYLGLQAIPGRAAFDLSTLKMRKTPYPYPRVNVDGRARYTPAFQKRMNRRFRGVMSPMRRMTEDDFKTLHGWGANLLRYQMTPHLDSALAVQESSARTDAEKVAFSKAWISLSLDHLEKDLIPWARKYGLMIAVDMHSVPGGQGIDGGVFTSDACARSYVDTWREIAVRFKRHAGVLYGYDLINEPNQRGLKKYDYWTLQKLAANAIRRVDSETPIIVASNGGGGPAAFSYLRPLPLNNVIYEVHMYQPFDFTHQGVGFVPKGAVYPDRAKGWDRAALEAYMKPVYDFAARHGARIYVGEFSAINWAKGAGDWMRDAIAVFEKHGSDWSFHAFREWPPWSVEHVDGSKPSGDNPRKRALLDGFAGKIVREISE